jgi:hypothetical protein
VLHAAGGSVKAPESSHFPQDARWMRHAGRRSLGLDQARVTGRRERGPGMECLAPRHKQGAGDRATGPAVGQLDLARSDVGQRLPLRRPWLTVVLTGPPCHPARWRCRGRPGRVQRRRNSRAAHHRQAIRSQAGAGVSCNGYMMRFPPSTGPGRDRPHQAAKWRQRCTGPALAARVTQPAGLVGLEAAQRIKSCWGNSLIDCIAQHSTPFPASPRQPGWMAGLL